ncbi:adenosylhomocysteinase [Thermobispora bispora]|uniref:Adenosylhomocysteinase n=1 Tax=Thermobispora bispora (strain ATCC 19993 / DSM 43833 / CBS 139.67 / JCM 10125 / KCTC 9307 / NBRC 14880 / R51) TaxID=469371 RepID=D6Y6B6_THEBD|nr:adenosylhomocysteinase [Thermobispora bispora]ADG87488.1 adenosylhomocysteinase [Thermobispora bispora DSM 43833]
MGTAEPVTPVGQAAEGELRIGWAARSMPVLAGIAERFARERPLDGLRIAACLHVTAETAVLLQVLREGGAEIALAASNPLSTQDDVAAALRERGIAVHARAGADLQTYYRHIHQALDIAPHLVLDDGCDLVNVLHTERVELLGDVVGGCEETTTGIIRLRQMAAEGALRFPVVAVNDTRTKRMVDNRYGTGQSTLDGIIRATNLLLAGRVVVVAGFGFCGRGVADRARGLGARVIVTEVDPVKALEAALQGYQVEPMSRAAELGDVFITVTGNRDVIRAEHFAVMKDGAVLANAGHFDVEIDVRALRELASAVRHGVRPNTDEYVLPDGRRLLLLAEGRVVNLTAAEGHPAAVMDISFSAHALAAAWLVTEGRGLPPGVHDLPSAIDAEIARLELAAAGVTIDTLTPDQERYLRSWRLGS